MRECVRGGKLAGTDGSRAAAPRSPQGWKPRCGYLSVRELGLYLRVLTRSGARGGHVGWTGLHDCSCAGPLPARCAPSSAGPGQPHVRGLPVSASVALQLEDFVRRHGPWTAHNIDLGDGVTTMGTRPVAEELALRRMLQAATDLAGRPLHELRVLDLGCNEGLFAIEFARHGAEVVGIEGREASLEKARFVQKLLKLDRLQFHCDDVRNLDEARYGRFDVVLCVGLLYHLDEPDVMEFIERMARVCDRVTLLHTHISIAPKVSCTWKGHTYWGRHFLEHLPDEDPTGAGWSSLDNLSSFWLTRASLCDVLPPPGRPRESGPSAWRSWGRSSPCSPTRAGRRRLHSPCLLPTSSA